MVVELSMTVVEASFGLTEFLMLKAPAENFLRGLRCISGFSGWLGLGRWHHLLRKSSPCENAEQEAQARREGDSCKRIATYRFVSLLNGLHGCVLSSLDLLVRQTGNRGS